MFGDKEIIGSEIVAFKNRKIKLPYFTNTEGDDILLLTKYGKDFAIFDAKSYLELINKLEEERRITEDKERKKELYHLIKQFYYSIIRELKCNKNFTITIPKNIPEKIDCDEFLCIGERRHLVLKPQKKN